MKLTSAAIAVLLLSAFVIQASASKTQNAPGARAGVLNLRDCLDKSKNTWIADIELEIQKLQEAESGRGTDLNPAERTRIRTKILDLTNKRRIEVYTEIVRLAGAIAKERGLDLVHRSDRMPAVESGDTDLGAQMDRRTIIHFDPSIDITAEVLERINKQHGEKKK